MTSMNTQTNVTTTSGNMTGIEYTPGTYRIDEAAWNKGVVVCNANGNEDAEFYFHISGSLTSASGSVVGLTNGAKFENVFWKVMGAVSIGEGSYFQGNIDCRGAVYINPHAIFTGTVVGAMSVS